MDPVDALNRIVYLLDRRRTESVKVRAFVRARDVIAAIDPDELKRLAATGGLEDLPGVGKTTGRVIAEALAGEEPSYLRHLEGETAVPLSEGAAIRQALKGDCHSHSTWSDGGWSIETMARAARDLGHEYLVVTDHSPRLTIAHGLSPQRLREQLAEIAALNEQLAPFRILTGMEVDILEDGSLDLEDDLLGTLDVVVASVHSKLRMEPRFMTRRMMKAMASPHTDILGHCTGRIVVGRGRPQSQFDAELVFAACAKFDKAVEINCRPERQDPPDELLTIALELGCRVAIDTDAHAPGQLEWQNYGCDKAARHGVSIDRIVNAHDADGLINWAAQHAAAA
jgi:putative hydrolase